MTHVFAEQSPLQNPLILELVASFLPTLDLRSCVQVSSLWSEEMGRVLKSRRVLDINFRIPKDINKIKEDILKNPRRKRRLSFKRMNFTGHLPRDDKFYKEILCKWGTLLGEISIYGYNSSWTPPTFYQLLDEFAPNLESLNVKLRNYPSRILSRRLVNPYAEDGVPLLRGLRNINREFKCSRLKRLKWNVVHSGYSFQQELMEMRYIFPSLISLSITTLDRYNIETEPLIPEEEFQEKVFWPSLQTFRYRSVELCCTTFGKLKNFNLKLESFSLIFSVLTSHQPEYEISDTIALFLNSVSSTLKSLAIYQQPISTHQFQNCSEKIGLHINLPHLPQLTTFKLFPGGSIPIQLPTLSKTGTIQNVQHFTGSLADVLSSYLRFSNLKSLNVILPKGVLSDDSNSSRVFPSVTHLVLHPHNVSDRNFRKLILMFPNLEYLKIDASILSHGERSFQPKVDPKTNLSPLTDSGITGIPMEDLHILMSANERISPDVLAALRKYPWIGSLKRLSKVELNFKFTVLTGKAHLFGTRYISLKPQNASNSPSV